MYSSCALEIRWGCPQYSELLHDARMGCPEYAELCDVGQDLITCHHSQHHRQERDSEVPTTGANLPTGSFSGKTFG